MKKRAKVDKIIEYIRHPEKIIFALNYPLGFKMLSDTHYLKLKFKYILGYKLNLESPKTFNEKLQWLKLYNRNAEYVKMVDKFEMKDYISKRIGKEFVVPVLGVWEKFDDISFDALPNQFVLKCTHSCGGIVICRDKSTMDLIVIKSSKGESKIDYATAKRIISKSLKRNYYFRSREWPYMNVKPRIIAEEYIDGDLWDYKLFCFNGVVKCTYVTIGSAGKEDAKYSFYDNSWIKMPFTLQHPSFDTDIAKPDKFNLMINIAELLSKDIPFLRVDFFEANRKLYISELTFYSEAGFGVFDPFSYDELLGSWITLPQNNKA